SLGQGPSVLGGTLTFPPAAATTSNVGTYALTPGGLTSSNYAIHFVAGTLTVTPAPLSATVDNVSKVYGAPNPLFTVSYSGFVLGQDAAALSGALTFATTADVESAPGTYPVSASGLASANYQISYTAGILQVLGEAVLVRADPDSPGKSLILIGGSPGNDQIMVTPGGQPGTVTVRINNGIQENLAAPAGTAFSRVRAFGGAGDDDIQVAGGVTLPTALFGGTGNDRLKAGNGGGILVGGDGDDLLIGGIGRDV